MAAFIKILLATVVALYFGLAGFASTPAGLQCPTAPVQMITAFQNRACGCPVKITRAPRPGDKGFVQCRCAEKKEGKTVGSSVKEALGCLNAPTDFACGTRLVLFAVPNPSDSKIDPFAVAPFVPPPSA